MKKFICILLSLIITTLTISASSHPYEDSVSEQKVTISDIYAGKFTSKSILNFNSSELNTGNQDTNHLKEFIKQGGIIVLLNDDSNSAQLLSEKLNMSIKISPVNLELESSYTDCEKDIATFFYNYGNGLSGIYVVSAQGSISNDSKDKLIIDAIDEIHDTQNYYSMSAVQSLTAGSTENTLGILTISNATEPKGKLVAKYEFFTVQDYNSEDRYIVKANVYGYPGATEHVTNSNYNKKYHGLSQKTIVKPTVSSVFLDDFDPQRTIGQSSYSVSIGATFNDKNGFLFNGCLNYTEKISKTNIETPCTRTQAEWDVTLKGDSREAICLFKPAACFSCPASKSSIILSVYSDYELDSWDTFSQTISVSRNVMLTPTGYSVV